MKKKGLIAGAVIAAMAISMMAPAAFAENNDLQMKTILQSVKERVEIPAEYSEFSSETHEWDGETDYEFTWNNKDNDKNISISCADDGVITRYYNTSEYAHIFNISIPPVSEEDARENAENFLKQLNPDFPYELKFTDYNIYEAGKSLYDSDYTFNFLTYVNGIKYDGGYGNITVNGITGNISSCDIGYTTLDFPSLENTISLEKAQKAYSEKLGLKLVYRTYTDENGKEIAYPVYVQKYSYDMDKYINAITGEAEDVTWGKGGSYESGSENAAAKPSADRGLTEQEIKEIENINGLISREDIETQLLNNKLLDIPDTVKVNYIRLSKYGDTYKYSIQMSDNENNNRISIYADAKTGEIQHYYRYGMTDSDKQTTQNDKAFKELAGDKANEYKYDEEEGRYLRYVNGIEVYGDDARITFNDGVLTLYSISYTDTEIPSVENAISKDEAEKIMFDNDGYEMVYIINYNGEEEEIVPAYKHEEININAFSGKYVDYKNEEIKDDENGIEYSDISGHYAEEYIKELAKYGIGFEGGEFKPDKKITQKEYLALLSSVYRGYRIVVMNDNKEQANDVYRTAFENNIISEDERDDNAAVTRDNAAVYMIRAMGAEEYAKYNDIYNAPFNDVSENKGYIALLSAMGVVSGDDNGNFNPNHEITRAESIVMIYNYLTR